MGALFPLLPSLLNFPLVAYSAARFLVFALVFLCMFLCFVLLHMWTKLSVICLFPLDLIHLAESPPVPLNTVINGKSFYIAEYYFIMFIYHIFFIYSWFLSVPVKLEIPGHSFNAPLIFPPLSLFLFSAENFPLILKMKFLYTFMFNCTVTYFKKLSWSRLRCCTGGKLMREHQGIQWCNIYICIYKSKQ